MPAPIPDFLAAILVQLRAWNNGAVPTALGEDLSTPAGTKIWADNAAYGQPDAPYLTYSEPECPLSPESKDSEGLIHYYGDGTLTFTLTDTDKLHCRNTARLIGSALNDADEEPTFAFANGYCLELRISNPHFPVVTTNEPNAPTTYQAVIEFHYVISLVFPTNSDFDLTPQPAEFCTYSFANGPFARYSG